MSDLFSPLTNVISPELFVLHSLTHYFCAQPEQVSVYRLNRNDRSPRELQVKTSGIAFYWCTVFSFFNILFQYMKNCPLAHFFAVFFGCFNFLILLSFSSTQFTATVIRHVSFFGHFLCPLRDACIICMSKARTATQKNRERNILLKCTTVNWNSLYFVTLHHNFPQVMLAVSY